MPIGPDHSPPGFNPNTQISIFSKFFLFIGGIIGAVLGAAGALAAPFVEAIRQTAFETNPNVAITPDQAAVAVVKNIDPTLDWTGEAKLSGIGPERFAELVKLTGNPPGPETLLEMWRRLPGFAEADARRGMLEGYLKDEWIADYEALKYGILSPADYV